LNCDYFGHFKENNLRISKIPEEPKLNPLQEGLLGFVWMRTVNTQTKALNQ